MSEGPPGRQLVTGSSRRKSTTRRWKTASAAGRKMASSCRLCMRSKRYGLGAGCHRPDKSGLPSGVLGAGAARFGLPSAVRGIPGVGQSSHCAPNETGSSNNAASAIRDMEAHSWRPTVTVYAAAKET